MTSIRALYIFIALVSGSPGSRNSLRVLQLHDTNRRRTDESPAPSTWNLIADGTKDEAGCDDSGMADSPDSPSSAYVTDLAACEARCVGQNYLQYHGASRWCSCFETCDLTRPAAQYFYRAVVYVSSGLRDSATALLTKVLAAEKASCQGDCAIVRDALTGLLWGSSKGGYAKGLGDSSSGPQLSEFPLRYTVQYKDRRCLGWTNANPNEKRESYVGDHLIDLGQDMKYDRSVQACWKLTEEEPGCGKGPEALFNYNKGHESDGWCQCVRDNGNCRPTEDWEDSSDRPDGRHANQKLRKWTVYRKMDVHFETTLRIVTEIKNAV